MAELSWRATKAFIFERAGGCCEYCQTCEDTCGQPMHVEHINPNGDNHPDNLCLACANCNLSKAKATLGMDNETGEKISLFNPRQQLWSEHFAWSDDKTHLLGLTATGRATINRLKINQERIITARKRWVESGHHPPT